MPHAGQKRLPGGTVEPQDGQVADTPRVYERPSAARASRCPRRQQTLRLSLKVRVRARRPRLRARGCDVRAPVAAGRERLRARHAAPTARSRPATCSSGCPPSPTSASPGAASPRGLSSSTSCSTSSTTRREGCGVRRERPDRLRDRPGCTALRRVGSGAPAPRGGGRPLARALGRHPRRAGARRAGARSRCPARGGADAFDGDTDALVHDLYGCAVDELARRALRTVPPSCGGRPARLERHRALPRGAGRAEPRAPRARRLPRARAPARVVGRRGPLPPLARAVEPRPPPRRAGSERRARSPSSSSSGSRRPTTRRSRSPRACCATGATRSSRFCARATRGARWSSGCS